MKIDIKEVRTDKEKNDFIKSQWLFYKNDPNFVPPLKLDRKKLLNTDKNPFYKHSKIKLFLAYNEGKIVGRIAGIINDLHNKTHNDNIGFFGFFESIDDINVSSKLFYAVEKWLKENNMDTIRGPVNPSMNDEVATLVDGFESPPVLLMTYNPKYYPNLIENYGFKKAKDLYAYKLVNKEYVSEKLGRMQNIVRDRYDITVRTVDFKNKSNFKRDVKILKDIYNKAWEPNWGFVKMTDEEFDYLANDFKSIADPLYALIVEVKGKPAGFALGIPDINQTLIHNKSGNLIPGIWHLLTKRKKINWLRILVLGVLPEYQRFGVDSVMYWEMGNRGLTKGIDFGEASWILEDNEMMKRGLTTIMQGKHYKTYRIYQKEL